MDIKLPKPYISYSQIRLWLENKEQYRDRYYRNLQERGSKYMMFGSEVAKGLESGALVIPGLPLYPVQEEAFKMEVDGIPFYAYIDQYWPEKFKFREIKTGSMRPGGKPRWTQADVQKHMQLDVYSLLVQLKHGQVDNECHLDWLKTRPKKRYLIDTFGNALESESNQMELTGEVESFARIITQEERDRMRSLINSVAREITLDYSEYLRLIPSTSPAASIVVSSPLSAT